MIYVFDTSSFVVLKNFYPSRFPTLWKKIDQLVRAKRLVSTREVLNELESREGEDFILDWAKSRKQVFPIPTNEELQFVNRIFSVPHFQSLIGQKSILKGSPVADPFVIGAAKVRDGFVVSEETKKPNAAKIPNVCEHFDIECINVEGFMNKEGWAF